MSDRARLRHRDGDGERGGASAQTKIDVITQPDSISVRQNGKAVSAITLSAGETATLTASAMYRHLPVLGDNKGFT